MELIDQYRQELESACIQYQVKELHVFGSVLSSDYNDESDIDFIVSIDSDNPLEYAENYLQLKFELEKIFKRSIDLLELKAIRNKVFLDLINKKKRLVYEG